MKTKLSLTILLSLVFGLLSSQVPQGFNYQAIARDGSGNVLQNTPLQVMFYVQSLSTGGTIFWKELHSTVTTNSFGLFTLVVGTGTRQTESTVATFNLIDWSVTPKFLKTEIYYTDSWKDLGTSQLLTVPYAMVASDLAGSVKKLAVEGETSGLDEALFEVKNKDGQTVFAVYNEGVRIYVSDGAKGVKGGFAVGGFGTDKAESTKYLFVGKDSVRIYLDTNPLTKKLKGGFAVGGYDLTKGTIVQDYLDVNSDSVRIYIDSNPATKKVKGGFAVGGYDLTKGTIQNYMNVSSDSVRIYVDTNPETKKLKGGFAVGGYDLTKDAVNEFFRVTSDSVKVSKSLLIPRMTTEERDNLPFTPGEALIIFNLTESCMQIFKNNVWSNIWCFNCAPSFIIQPVDQTICSDETAVFFVSATGTNLNYQWQESRDEGSTWNDISNGGSIPTYSGATEYTLKISNIPSSYHNYKYRCLVRGSCQPDVISNVVTLNVISTPIITSQPVNKVLSGSCDVSFSITATGYGVQYQWQQSDDGGSTWINISNGGISPVFDGATNSTLSMTNVPWSYNNYKYHCILSTSCDLNITSGTAILQINPLIITKQPLSRLVYPGMNALFTISVSGTGFNYQWQVSTDEGNTWSDITEGIYDGGRTIVLVDIQSTSNGYKYRCIVNHMCHPPEVSDVATLTVITTPITVTDVDGNIYTTMGKGYNIWMVENLKTTHFDYGSYVEKIPLVTDKTTWTSGGYGYCYYNNDSVSYKETYGALYNWFTACSNLCPSGWHLPSLNDWSDLFGSTDNGGKLKETGTLHWNSPNTGATNEWGFTALPGGARLNGDFSSLGEGGSWWSSYGSSTMAYAYGLLYNSSSIQALNYNKKEGASVRCIKDN